MSHIGRPTFFFAGLRWVFPVLIEFTSPQLAHWMYNIEPRPWVVSSTVLTKLRTSLQSEQPTFSWSTITPNSTILRPSLQLSFVLWISFSSRVSAVFRDLFSFGESSDSRLLFLKQANRPFRFLLRLFDSILLTFQSSHHCRENLSLFWFSRVFPQHRVIAWSLSCVMRS